MTTSKHKVKLYRHISISEQTENKIISVCRNEPLYVYDKEL